MARTRRSQARKQAQPPSGTSPLTAATPAPQTAPAAAVVAQAAVADGRRLALFVAVAVLVAGLYDALVVTHGTLRFDGTESGWKIFPGLWRSLAQGRFDIDPADIRGEAFHRDGKSYSYYGLFPAMLRGLASPFFDLRKGGLSQLSCLLAAVVTFTSCLWAGVHLRAHRAPQRPLFVLYVITLAFATPVVFGLAIADVYNEAVLWGSAWTMVFNAALVVFAESPPGSTAWRRTLVLMAAAVGLALHSRATAGMAAAFSLGGVYLCLRSDGWATSKSEAATADAPSQAWWRPLIPSLVVIGAFVAFQAFENYERWGDALEFRPMQLHEAFQGKRRGELAARHGQFGLDRLGTSACFYLMPEPGNLKSEWPFVAPAGERCFAPNFPFSQLLYAHWQVAGLLVPPEVTPYYDLIEGPRMPLTIASPALLLFAILGVVRFRTASLWRKRAIVLIGLGGVITAGLLLTLDTLALRYEVDLVPVLAGLGLMAVVPGPRVLPEKRPQRMALLAGVAFLVAFSINATQYTTLLDWAVRYQIPRETRLLARRILGTTFDPSPFAVPDDLPNIDNQ